ncbi:two-component response regulator [Pseudomonas aeruginosa]|nr:two-component response regulator [Pseudomonas aeruginosa]
MSELLLIDDDRELCELLGTWLVQEGFSVRASHDGARPVAPSPSRRRMPWCST